MLSSHNADFAIFPNPPVCPLAPGVFFVYNVTDKPENGGILPQKEIDFSIKECERE